ncbi:hypothetical protein AURDEDRAFT_179334 [Auricularia subglabra TFB-10046 SS5]|nr:hypothetical protein AURDEDRAFT_179334 [Auricularia subglabra TFB-10046 SS5]
MPRSRSSSSSGSSSNNSSDNGHGNLHVPWLSAVHRHHSIDSDDDYEQRLLELDRLQAEKEWQEGIEQLYTIVCLVLLPLAGKYFGRKTSVLLHERYNRVGLGLRFFVGQRIASYFPGR